jgi:lipoyl(octanoyl) transferase
MVDLALFLNPEVNFYVRTIWNWDYLEAESFQLECVQYVQENPHIVLMLICNHPSCFTMGRGLQKLKDSNHQLIEFDPSLTLSYPLYNIKRGGGLTFHYPGQIVVYPIMNLTVKKWAIYDLMIIILEITLKILNEKFSVNDLIVKKDLLGLWQESIFGTFKIAFIGLAASRYTTYHGMALNFFNDTEMFNVLNKEVYPCGLKGNTYTSLESLTDKTGVSLDKNVFVEEFITVFLDTLNKKIIVGD